MYLGQFAAHQEGTYQVVLPVPDSNEEPFSKYIQVRVPDLERAHPERNEPLLASLAKETGGQYYAQLEDAVRGNGDEKSLADSIQSRAEVKLLKGAPDPEFAQWQMRSLLGVIAGALVYRMDRSPIESAGLERWLIRPHNTICPSACSRNCTKSVAAFASMCGSKALAAIAIALAVAFWVGLLLDWLFEPPPSVRLAGMVLAAAAVLWIAYRFLLRRAFVRLNDASMAMVMERRFPELGEHMLTAVDDGRAGGGCGDYNPELVARTQEAAARAIEKLDTGGAIPARAAAADDRCGGAIGSVDSGFRRVVERRLSHLDGANRARSGALAAASSFGSRRLSSGQ